MISRILGLLIAVASALVFLAGFHARLEGAVFLTGVGYGLILVFHDRLAAASGILGNRPLLTYGILVFLGGMLVELAAYGSNVPRIRAGEKAYLFSTHLVQDLCVGLPHYVVLGFTWAWLLKRYQLVAGQQAVLIGLFWGLVVDNFSHFLALLSGNVLDFVVSGLVMVFALNGPLVILQGRLAEVFPRRSTHWTRFPVMFLAQAVPMVVLMLSGLLLKR